MGVGYPQIIHFHRIFPCKPAIMGGTSIYVNPHMYHLFSGMLFFSIFFKVAIYMCAWIAEISGRNSDLPETKLGFSCCEGKGGPPSRSCNHSRFITQKNWLAHWCLMMLAHFAAPSFSRLFQRGWFWFWWRSSMEIPSKHRGWSQPPSPLCWPLLWCGLGLNLADRKRFSGRKLRRSQTKPFESACKGV